MRSISRIIGLLLLAGLVGRVFDVLRHFLSLGKLKVVQVHNEEIVTPFPHPPRNVKKLEKYIEETTIRYFVYNDTEIRLPHLRSLVRTGEKPTWRFQWGTRWFDCSKWDLLQIEALENHPLRTFDPHEADFFFVPIPFGASVFWAQKGQESQHISALKFLLQNKIYRKFSSSKKHVLLTSIEYFFSPYRTMFFEGFREYYNKVLRDFTIVRSEDVHVYQYGLQRGSFLRISHNDFNNQILSEYLAQRYRNTWSISLSGAATRFSGREEVEFHNLDALRANQTLMTEFQQRRLHFFYRTVNASSRNNSTIYRHALCNVSEELTQPSSVGYSIDKKQWSEDFSSSRFCPTIRGDNPFSRSLPRAIRTGCIPVIVSDLLPYFSPMFGSLVKYSDFAIIVPENEFLANPSRSLNDAIAGLYRYKLQDMLERLALMQRLIVLDHPKPLFVQAFCRETVASFHPSYRDRSLFKP